MGSSFVPLHNYSRAQIFLLYFFFVSNTIMTAYEKDIYAISSSSTIFAAIFLLYFQERILSSGFWLLNILKQFTNQWIFRKYYWIYFENMYPYHTVLKNRT